MSLASLLNAWRADPSLSESIAAWKVLPARPARCVPLPEDLHPRLAAALLRQGIRSLYTHQAQAWERVRTGEHPVIVTGTASGKTLCYNLPVLNALLRDPESRALYLFPTKALAQDQKDQLVRLIQEVPSSKSKVRSPKSKACDLGPGTWDSGRMIPISTYDGDTPSSARAAIRNQTRLVITNPDMLHTGVLPHHTLWAGFLRGLRFVVIDEMHAYRGVFGSHVANVVRRLKRVARFYGASPQFILTSATIANPAELADRLVEEPVSLVDDDGAGRGERNLLIYNPPLTDRALGLRRSALLESVRMVRELVESDVQTILFGRARQTVERMLAYLQGVNAEPRMASPPESAKPPTPKSEIRTPKSGGASGREVRAYRSGYLPSHRREIERGLRDGSVRAVAATSALELGIDIGGMGAAVLAGYPGTIAGTWQQMGRAGRGNEASLAALVACPDPLDQFLARHPGYFFGRSPECALINPDNLLILLAHLRCAAFELPFRTGEGFGRVDPLRVAEFLEVLRESGVLHRSGEGYFWMADRYPAQGLSLRSASPETVLLHTEEGEGCRTIGQVDLASAAWMVHPQAVYMQEGQAYEVEALDLERNCARLRPIEADFYTVPHRETTVQRLEILREEKACGAVRAYGEIRVTTRVVGFHRVKWYTHERLGGGDLDLPPSELRTTGYWLALSDGTVADLRGRGIWRGDANDYGPGWSEARDRARSRDGFRCQVCGAPEGDRIHDVHHRIPFRAFADPRQAHGSHNLTTLCPPCHRRAEVAVRMRSGLSGLAFVLGHLAPLFVMCDARDLGVQSDPSSPLAEGRPAIVLYDTVPAGIGLSERLFELHDEVLGRARELVAACECVEGCPSCVGPAGENGAGGRRETLAILDALLPPG